MLEQALENLEKMVYNRKYIPIAGPKIETNIVKRLTDKKFITPDGTFALVAQIDSTSQIKSYASFIEDPEFVTIIFVYMNNLTVTHKSIEKVLNNKIEIWSIQTLLIDVYEHELQPKIELVKNFEHKIKLPKISFYDPIVRYFRYQHQDVLRIIDLEGTISYRLVS